MVSKRKPKTSHRLCPRERLARQVKALERTRSARFCSDTASGKTLAGHPQIAAALEELDRDDELVIAEWIALRARRRALASPSIGVPWIDDG